MAKETQKHKHTPDMTSGTIVGPLLFFILPIIGSSIFQQLYNTVDFIFIGNVLDRTAAAAVGASSALVYCCIGLFSGISVGTSVVIAQAIGAKDDARADRALHTSAGFSLLGGIVLSSVTIVFAPGILRLLNTPVSVIQQAVVYMRLYMLSAPAMIFYNMCAGALRATGDSDTPFRILALCGLINVAADALFLLVIPMGVAGVALATLLSQVLSAVLAILALRRKGSPLHLRAREIRIDAAILREVLRIGLPAGFQALVITVSNVIVQYYINAFGETDVAAFAAYYKVENFIYLPIMAFGLAATTFVGQNFGARQMRRVMRGSNLTLLMCIAVTVCISGLILLFPETVLGWFMKDSAVVKRAVLIACVSFPFYWLYAFLEVYGGALRGMGNSLEPMVIIISNVCVLRITLLAIFSHTVGTLRSIASVYPITWGGAALCFIIAFWLAMKKYKSEIRNT